MITFSLSYTNVLLTPCINCICPDLYFFSVKRTYRRDALISDASRNVHARYIYGSTHASRYIYIYIYAVLVSSKGNSSVHWSLYNVFQNFVGSLCLLTIPKLYIVSITGHMYRTERRVLGAACWSMLHRVSAPPVNCATTQDVYIGIYLNENISGAN